VITIHVGGPTRQHSSCSAHTKIARQVRRDTLEESPRDLVRLRVLVEHRRQERARRRLHGGDPDLQLRRICCEQRQICATEYVAIVVDLDRIPF